MPSKVPFLDKTNADKIHSWNSDMQDLQTEVHEALTAALDTQSDAAGLVAAVNAILAPYNEGLDDQLNAELLYGQCEVENNNSGDGCTVVRQGDKWWLKSTKYADHGQPSSADAQHGEVASTIMDYIWWGDYDMMTELTHDALRALSDG